MRQARAGYPPGMRNGRIPLAVHAMAEPFLALLLVTAPFLFGFSDDSSPTALAIGAGVLIAVLAMSTNWRLSIFKVIPLPVHMLADLALGTLLVLSPFLLGFSESSAPTIFFVLFGVSEVLAAMATRWTHAEDIGRAEAGSRRDEDERFTRSDGALDSTADRERRRQEREVARELEPRGPAS